MAGGGCGEADWFGEMKCWCQLFSWARVEVVFEISVRFGLLSGSFTFLGCEFLDLVY